MQAKRKISLLAFALGAALTLTSVFSPSAGAVAEKWQIQRLDGARREDVAKKVSDTFFTEGKKADKVILVNDMAFADAISSTNISQGKYPILYTKKDAMPAATIQVLKNLKPSQVYIMGGTGSVSESVAASVQSLTGTTPIRVGGRDRYEVSANAAKYCGKVDRIVVTTGQVYSDALVAAPYAHKKNAAVLLVGAQFPTAIQNYVKTLGNVACEIIGGPGSVPESYANTLQRLTGSTPTRITGANRYEVSAAVAKQNFADAKQAFLASGEVFSDALSASSAAQQLNAPILLVRKDQTSSDVASYLKDNKVLATLYTMGGFGTISESNLTSLKSTLGGQDENPGYPQEKKPGRVVDVTKLPTVVQEALKTLESDMSTEGATEFVAKLNSLRKDAGLKPLTYDPNLSIEAAYRLMFAQKTGMLPTGGQYWSGDEYYRVSGLFGYDPDLMGNLNRVYLNNGGSGTITAIGLAKYNGAWSFYFGGNFNDPNIDNSYRHILKGTYEDGQIDRVLTLLNEQRAAYGATPVSIDPVLAKLAKSRAREATGLMSHIRPDGLKYTAEFQRKGMYTAMGESVASVPSAQDFIDGLMNHAPHQHTVVNPKYTHVGISVFSAEDGRLYWEVVWGAKDTSYDPNFELKDLSHLYR
ncbi:cell wall-binding repeat-containing protein [Murdochiella sp. Marseille-P8839]|nr:cell wall-binding repeat-containing protein [Murdochiella sp. Marseille-P8839]